MKRVLALIVAAGLSATAAMGSNINISVQQTNGTNTVGPVAPGTVVPYKVVGQLNDGVNEGLALFGASLDFTAGPLTVGISPLAGTSSCVEPMRAFVIPNGITNPGAGAFGGTVIVGAPPCPSAGRACLIQAGGAQNTIKNTMDNAAFPIGAVTTGIAQPAPGCGQAVLLTGSLTVPLGTPNGEYFLNAFDVFANVITDGQDGSGAFWATEAAGVGSACIAPAVFPTCSVFGLKVIVQGGVLPVTLASSIPPFTSPGGALAVVPANGTLWRDLRHVIRLTFSGALPVAPPTAAQLDIRELLAGGAFGATNLSGSFTYEIAGNTLRIREPSATTTVLEHRKWYAIRNLGTPPAWTGVANFEAQFPVQAGDSQGNNNVNGNDVLTINASFCLAACGDQNRNDVDGGGSVNSNDVLRANSHVTSFAVGRPGGH